MKKFNEKCDEILVEKKLDLQDIIDRAIQIEADTVTLKRDAKQFILDNEEFGIKVDEVDDKFWKKIKNYPGDITAHRIANTFSKAKGA